MDSDDLRSALISGADERQGINDDQFHGTRRHQATMFAFRSDDELSLSGGRIHRFWVAGSSVLAVFILVAFSSYLFRRIGYVPEEEVQSPFPNREITLSMASLSKVIYLFHRSTLPGEELCQIFNDRNFTGFSIVDEFGQSNLPPNDTFCHWYHHNWSLGSQIMIIESKQAKYVAVVYCGTDDLQTSLTDVNIFRTRYGLSSNGTEIISGIDSNVLVHAGFDHAVFDDDMFNIVLRKVKATLKPRYRIYTSGHSLGAADAILTAVGLIDQLDRNVTVLNFGCPRTGNVAWRNFIHANERLSIWRFVLGWDLVPRLPEFYYHVGHTVQLSDHGNNETMRAYYQHVGNTTLGYASVPMGWSATPFVWVPGALSSHRMTRYRLFLSSATEWVNAFVRVDDDDYPDAIDDDFYVNPPDDEYGSYVSLESNV